MVDAKLTDEPGRVAALKRYDLLDTPDEARFDRITELVKTILKVPVATVSLIDTDRQWLKSCVGSLAREVSRESAFCAFTIQSREPLYVPDAYLDERFRKNAAGGGGALHPELPGGSAVHARWLQRWVAVCDRLQAEGV